MEGAASRDMLWGVFNAILSLLRLSAARSMNLIGQSIHAALFSVLLALVEILWFLFVKKENRWSAFKTQGLIVLFVFCFVWAADFLFLFPREIATLNPPRLRYHVSANLFPMKFYFFGQRSFDLPLNHTDGMEVKLNGMAQTEGDDYRLDGKRISFVSYLNASDRVEIAYYR